MKGLRKISRIHPTLDFIMKQATQGKLSENIKAITSKIINFPALAWGNYKQWRKELYSSIFFLGGD